MAGAGLRWSKSVHRRSSAVLGAAVVWALLLPKVGLGRQTSPPETPVERSPAAALAGEYVDAFTYRQRLAAGNRFLARDLERLDQIDEPGSASRALVDELKRIDADALGTLAYVLRQNAEPVVRDVCEAAETLNRQADELEAAWVETRTSLNEARWLLFEVQAGRRVAGRLASLLSVDKRWFWLFGVVAMATLLGVVLHDRRRELRRMLNGGRARSMRLSKFLSGALVVLVALTLAVFVMGDRIYEALVSVGSGERAAGRRSIAEENALLGAEVEALQRQRDGLRREHTEAEAEWERRLGDALPAGNRTAAPWRQFRRGTLELVETLAVLEGLPRAMEADLHELETVNRELNTLAEARAGYLRLRHWIRGGLGLALLGLAAGGGMLFRRGALARRRKTANTCPLCLGVNRLERVEGHPDGSEARGELGSVQCKCVISEEPYEECDYTFLEVYRWMAKTRFPTLGVPQAGKTHWLTMLYWELNRGNYPPTVQFEKARSPSSEDFDVIVEEILRSRIGTAATQRERIPHPLVFNFQDRDRWGRSSVLVNIFDYSGEVTADMGLEDYRRRRALDGDGFFFFLDPTYPGEPQAKALADFREDIRVVKGVPSGKRLRTPVALCVSKIDLLAAQSYATSGDGDPIARYYDELGEIDPTGEAMALDVFEARSRLTARLRDTIWPGWQIERQIDDLFGGRYLFFPLTPVGLDGVGETDLSLRTISPFGLLEPLLWLLEMSGYPVLD